MADMMKMVVAWLVLAGGIVHLANAWGNNVLSFAGPTGAMWIMGLAGAAGIYAGAYMLGWVGK